MNSELQQYYFRATSTGPDFLKVEKLTRYDFNALLKAIDTITEVNTVDMVVQFATFTTFQREFYLLRSIPRLCSFQMAQFTDPI